MTRNEFALLVKNYQMNAAFLAKMKGRKKLTKTQKDNLEHRAAQQIDRAFQIKANKGKFDLKSANPGSMSASAGSAATAKADATK